MPSPTQAAPVPATPLIERLRQVDESLPKSFDALNAAITEAETSLRTLNPIDETWVECGQDVGDYGDLEVTRYVGFSKHGGKWRLMQSSVYHQENESSSRPLTDSPIAVRVEAVFKIPQLQEQIVKNKEAFVHKVNDAVSLLKSLSVKS